MTIFSAIGNTPLVELEKLNPNKRVRILAKLEGSNPAGSVKDRVAWYMIKSALESGELNSSKVVVEATSGNTGIGLGMVCSYFGLRLKLFMPACVSEERKAILRAFGAELFLTPAERGTDGAIEEAYKVVESSPDEYFMPNQFNNKANLDAHYYGTGEEIWRQTNGTVTHFVAGIGTGGTLMGAGRRLKHYNPKIKVIGMEPVEGHRIQGLKNMKESMSPGIFDPTKADKFLWVNDEQAFDWTRKLAILEGIFAGMSSGAAVYGAVEVAKEAEPGSTIVVVLPDRGDRYLSTALFTSICAKCPP